MSRCDISFPVLITPVVLASLGKRAVMPRSSKIVSRSCAQALQVAVGERIHIHAFVFAKQQSTPSIDFHGVIRKEAEARLPRLIQSKLAKLLAQ